MKDLYSACELCMRRCGVDRNSGSVGFCKCNAEMTVSRCDLHMWEEPIISGEKGSGTIFFSGCSLGCIFCQNSKISRSQVGESVTPDELAHMMLSLQKRGAHNINFVTPTHFAPSIVSSVALAKEKGLDIPIVYNTGTYDAESTIRLLDGTVDVYLPDFKYYLSRSAEKLSNAKDYPDVSRKAIELMVKQRGAPIIKDGLMKSGVVVRVLLLPQHVAEAKLSLKYLYNTYGDDIYISIMSQYTPIGNVPSPLDRKITRGEYEQICDYAVSLGIKNAFVQELTSATEAYIPDFKI